MSRPVAVVTGASSGIGEAFARELARRGHDVVLVARRVERLHALAAELETLGARGWPLPLDLGAPGAGEALAAGLADLGLAPALLINNAGVGHYGPLLDAAPETLDAMIAVNVVGMTAVTRAVYPGMARRGQGGIVHVASLAGFQGMANMAVYAATKAYVIAFSEGLSEEAQTHGVTVTCLCPGNTESEIHGLSGVDPEAVRRVPMMSAEDVVNEGLAALSFGRPVHVAGPLNAFGAGLSRLVPRTLATRLAGALLKLGAGR